MRLNSLLPWIALLCAWIASSNHRSTDCAIFLAAGLIIMAMPESPKPTTPAGPQAMEGE